jgi:hypothetical protein
VATLLLASCATEADQGTTLVIESHPSASAAGSSPGGHGGTAGSPGGAAGSLAAGTGGSTTSGAAGAEPIHAGSAGQSSGGNAGMAGTGGGTAGQSSAGMAGTGGYGGSSAGSGGLSGAGGSAGLSGAGGSAGLSGAGGSAGLSGSGGSAGVAGTGGGCPADTVAIESFCMDRYEAPNEPGAAPLAMQTAIEGAAWCAARGKRLCSEAEWVRACEGLSKTTYPYGNTHEAHRCDDDKTWIPPDWTTLASWPSPAAQAEAAKLYQADPSGSRTGCVSEDGAFDLTGNVAEWVTRSFDHASNYDHVMKGCYWAGCYGGSLPNCSFVNPAHPGTFRSYEAGFRCCQDAGL